MCNIADVCASNRRGVLSKRGRKWTEIYIVEVCLTNTFERNGGLITNSLLGMVELIGKEAC